MTDARILTLATGIETAAPAAASAQSDLLGALRDVKWRPPMLWPRRGERNRVLAGDSTPSSSRLHRQHRDENVTVLYGAYGKNGARLADRSSLP
jgi:hypothetical protein